MSLTLSLEDIYEHFCRNKTGLSRRNRLFVKQNCLKLYFIGLIVLILVNYGIYLLWVKLTLAHEFPNTHKHTLNETTNITLNFTEVLSSKYYRWMPSSTKSLPICIRSISKLEKYKPDMRVLPWSNISRKYPAVREGHWMPSRCKSNKKVAVIIPYRNREVHLQILLNNLHQFLQNQMLDYGIFVIDQLPGSDFNRAMLFNIGYEESRKIYDFECFIFHDVDLIPENNLNLYECGENPRHLSVYINKFNYRLPYKDLFGGAIALTDQQMQRLNGFSNLYFGWGGEDDDMSKRLRNMKYVIDRYCAPIPRYLMIKHGTDKGNTPNHFRHNLYNYALNRVDVDGLNSLQYRVTESQSQRVMWHIKIEINQKYYQWKYAKYYHISFDLFEIQEHFLLVCLMLILMIICMSVLLALFICFFKLLAH